MKNGKPLEPDAVSIIHVEYAVGAHELCAPELSKTLRELAELLEANEIGNHACETYIGPRGTRIILIGATLKSAECIPQRVSNLLS
jgi:hypothetical protein